MTGREGEEVNRNGIALDGLPFNRLSEKWTGLTAPASLAPILECHISVMSFPCFSFVKYISDTNSCRSTTQPSLMETIIWLYYFFEKLMTSVNPGKVPDIFLSRSLSNHHAFSVSMHGFAVRSLFAVPHPLLIIMNSLNRFCIRAPCNFHGVLINEKSPWQNAELWSKSSRNARSFLNCSWTCMSFCVPSSLCQCHDSFQQYRTRMYP